MSIPLENLRRDLRTRLESDKQMSGAWAIVPLLPTIVVIVVTAVVFAVIFSALGNIPRTPTPTNSTVSTIGPLIAALIGAIILTYLSYFILLILVIVLIFKLVSRRNNHFNRQIRNPPIPDRSFALYFVLTLITGSIFGVYWVYVLVTDPNNHFRQQMLMEDTIMAQLSSTSPPTSPLPSAPTS